MENEIRTNLIKFIREHTLTKTVDIVDNDGSNPRTLTVPMWRSDDLKLIYPEYFFNQDEIDHIVEMIDAYLADNDLNYMVEVTDNYYIEAAHCYGWKVKITEFN